MAVKVVHNAYSPKETVELCSRAGVAKANMRLDKIFISSFMAGCLLSFACAVLLSTNSSEWYQTNAAGFIRMVGAIVFPFGLVTIVLTGADLCTGSFFYTTIAVLHRRLSILKMLRHWTITFFGNLAGMLDAIYTTFWVPQTHSSIGSLFVACLITGYGGTFDAGYYHTEAQNFAKAKAIV